MTNEQFFKELKKISGWEIQPYTALVRIKIGRNTYCPITAVAHKKGLGSFSSVDFQDAALVLGLNPTMASRIADAADVFRKTVYRKKLLEVCKLKEI
jgi:hypothetical protein